MQRWSHGPFQSIWSKAASKFYLELNNQKQTSISQQKKKMYSKIGASLIINHTHAAMNMSVWSSSSTHGKLMLSVKLGQYTVSFLWFAVIQTVIIIVQIYFLII